MPRPPSVTSLNIDEAAFSLVRRLGSQALTARAIAAELGVSTQPLYTMRASMEDVQAAVELRVLVFVEQYLAQESAHAVPGCPYLNIGLRTFELAKEEPQLFKIFSGLISKTMHEPVPRHVMRAMQVDPRLKGLPERELVRLNELLWIMSQGLAAVAIDAGREPAWAREQLVFAAEAMIERLLKSDSGQDETREQPIVSSRVQPAAVKKRSLERTRRKR